MVLFTLSLLYDTFFESIVFEDAPILKSPFLASLVCSSETDRKIRVNVYYTSSLSGGKETIIAATTFGLREMLRVGKGPFQTDMISEHCASPKAIISVVSTPANPFSSQFFSLSSSTEKNPLSQQYVFYRNDESVPTVICDEITYEPAFPVQVPLAFLQHFSRVLQESILAWEDRCKLERIRQGKFVSIAEAHKHGWHQLRITVLSTRIRSQVDTLSAVTSALLSTTVDECVDDGDIASPPPILLQGTASPVPTRQISSSSVAGTARTASTIEESKPKVTWGTFVEVLLESE